MNMDPSKLWAKSKRDDEDEHSSMLLPQHLKDVYAAAEKVLDATGDDQLNALGLDPTKYRERLRRCVLLAAAVHDLGKANDHFQGMLLRTPARHNKPQGLRHEWVTVLMLQHLHNWLLPAVGESETDFAIVEWAVAGHHPGHDHASPPSGTPKDGGSGPEINLLVEYSEFPLILTWMKTTFQNPNEPPKLGSSNRQLNSIDVFAELKGWSKSARRLWDMVPPEDKKLVAAVKNCLIASDVAGSALPRELPNDEDRWDWITESFASKPEAGDLQAIIEERSRTFVHRNEDRERFQADVANSTAPVTFVKAGCGTGKTLAAYMWAAKNHPTRRLYFCYPTTGTATEGFRDYLFEPEGELGGIGAKLFHSRRKVDEEIILTTGNDSKFPDADATTRLESLEAWATPIVACTVDAVLGVIQNNKCGLFAWPALAQSAFIFDEIHAYDDRLFGALLRFLRDLRELPALLMTASLPKHREEALRNILRFRGLELNPIPGPMELEKLPRYNRVDVKNNDPMELVKKVLDAQGKVLWVCNTVGRVMDAANKAEKAGLKPLIYHSRFRYEDRVKQHVSVIAAFDPKENDGKALAICSQVAEMSLDLSADLLVTDLAPVPAIIQRLGRLNRRAKQKNDPTKPFVVIEPDALKPYVPYVDIHGDPDPSGWPQTTREWLKKLSTSDINQLKLTEVWEQTVEVGEYPLESKWLDGGPKTEIGTLRNESIGITVLMQDDLLKVKQKPKLIGRFVLPMPSPWGLDWRKWERVRGLPVAPTGTIIYDPKRGASWANA
jgi:CRISPR-associated endonuclease/helicase Cas3